jgi:adenylate cyclase
VLKLIGDGLLAIFQTPDDLTAQSAAASNALAAISDARAGLKEEGIAFRAALHIGEIHYGNIGSGKRLDFTAIGPAVNLTSRLLAAADEETGDTVCSAAFQELRPDHAELVSEVTFKGFDSAQQIYRI